MTLSEQYAVLSRAKYACQNPMVHLATTMMRHMDRVRAMLVDEGYNTPDVVLAYIDSIHLLAGVCPWCGTRWDEHFSQAQQVIFR